MRKTVPGTGLALALGSALLLVGCVAASADGPATAEVQDDAALKIAQAVAAPGRPADEVAQDAGRKPVETLLFMGLKPGMDVADLIPGTGYWSEIMAPVARSVTALQPNQFGNGDTAIAGWDALIQRNDTVKLARYPFENFTYPANSFDLAIMNLNYHDLYWESEQFKIPRTDPAAYLRNLYTAMRPGGIVGIIDHVGEAGDTRKIVDTLHRIDAAVVRADFERAGFVLDAESDLLANPEDDHSKIVFDPSVRGKTDRFMMRFRKPN